MKNLIIFGKNYTATINKNSDEDSVKISKRRIIVNTCKKSADSLVREFLEDLLYSQLLRSYSRLRKRKGVEVFKEIDFKVVREIDCKKQRIAKLSGDKILVKINAISLPKPILEYVIAHEIAHMFTKKHTKKFWKIVELMCPHYEISRELLTEYAFSITQPIIAIFR